LQRRSWDDALSGLAFIFALFVWMDAAQEAEMAQRKSALSAVPADGVPVGCARSQHQASSISPGRYLWRRPPGRSTRSDLAMRWKTEKKRLATGGNRHIIAGNEPDAEAILPEPRSVQKAISYQFLSV